MKALLVGFRKYAQHDSNPSEKILARFSEKKDIQTLLLEANYEKTKESLEKAIGNDRLSFVLVLNLTPYHKKPTLEQYGYNEMDSRQPDESGVVKTGQAICEGEAESLSTTFDLASFHRSLAAEEIETSLSVDGGRFVDNEAYYLALRSGVPSLMIHLPFEEELSVGEGEKLIETVLGIVSKNA